MLLDMDSTHSHVIRFDEFLDMMTARLINKDSHFDFKKVFRLFDVEGTGTITEDNIDRVAKEIGEHLTPEQLNKMISRVDTSGTGQVNLKDFCNMMSKPT
eukprot:GHVR01156230.1.p1 GENE.GHVR01156230.1~~GHVR01156230.1.p1  ORF type:complete len:100 (+),score=20.60 GHVR01156230.1:73-372(+)